MKNRVKKIFGYVDDEIDIIIIKNSIAPCIDLSFFYVTGFKNGIFERCVALLYPDGGIKVLTTSVDKESVQKTPFEVFKNVAERNDILRKELKGKNIGVNFSVLPHKDVINLKKIGCQNLTDVGYAFQKARLVKDNKEIEYIKKACKISSNVANDLVSLMKEGMSECEMASEIIYHTHKQGGSMAFSPIVAFGKNSAHPHYSFGDNKLMKGIALFDFGAKYKRYCSDVTRTFHYGKPTNKFLKMYKVVVDAQNIAIDLIKPGVSVAEVHRKVNDFIRKNGFGDMIHSTGHSLGLAVHDGEVLHSRSQMVLCEGMVFTIEPGIYILGFGGVRMEDDIVVTKEGVEILTAKHMD